VTWTSFHWSIKECSTVLGKPTLHFRKIIMMKNYYNKIIWSDGIVISDTLYHIKYWLNHYGWNRRGWLGIRVS
jgi:hypothetical protein